MFSLSIVRIKEDNYEDLFLDFKNSEHIEKSNFGLKENKNFDIIPTNDIKTLKDVESITNWRLHGLYKVEDLVDTELSWFELPANCFRSDIVIVYKKESTKEK